MVSHRSREPCLRSAVGPILPMFAGILKKGSGLGPAITFLYAGPAINILAIVYTAKVLGFDLGIARAVSAIVLSILIGLIMMALFPQHDVETTKTFRAARKAAVECADTRPNGSFPPSLSSWSQSS